ncbi:MAG TPA: GGDEF domain-containing protein [Azospirillaceae bacterium]|nr:GGDEF domain-containing protein [Azospirillaceae bacterium]
MAWRKQHVRVQMSGPVIVGALALLGYAAWDTVLDPRWAAWSVAIRLSGALIMIACVWKLARDPEAPLTPLSLLIVTAGTSAIALTQFLVDRGWDFGTAGLALFPTVSAIAVVRARDIPAVNLPPFLVVAGLLALDGVSGFVLFNTLAFLGTGIFTAYILAIGLERSYREAYRLEANLEAEARQDPLTGVANRRRFVEQAVLEVERTRRFQRPLSALLLDLDHFKRINDSHGHAVGDEVLRAVAQLCQRSLRQTDLFARLGGEEFVALLPETDIEEAAILGERLRALLEATPALETPSRLVVTTCVGVATCDLSNPSWQDMLEAGDRALYEAKRRGRNRVVRADRIDERLEEAV